MLSDEVIEKVVERLVNRIEQGNEYIMQKIGESVKKIGTLTPSKAQELVQILRYGGDYDKIVKKLEEITKLNKKDIYKIFEEVAKTDYNFAEQFYKYRNKKYIPWEDNIALQRQVRAIAKRTADEYVNLSRSSMLGYGWQDDNGKTVFKNLKKTYDDILDEAVLNTMQGKETFDSAMYKSLKQLGGSGLKVIFPTTYETTDKNGNKITKHRTMRLDSALRMQMNSAIRDEHISMQEEIGKQFDADGVEISVHIHPAPDHELVQGRQFRLKEFNKFQNDEDSVSYDGIEFPAVSNETGYDRRSISQYNCQHFTFQIVLGVSTPRYSNDELQAIIDRNNEGFEFEGKHYTMYEGLQLQRKLELEIRKAKDEQILGRSADNKKLIYESQKRIDVLNRKYKKLSKESGLLEQRDRMRVSGYHKVKVLDSKDIKRIDFSEYRKIIDDTKTLPDLEDKFNYEGFINNYNKWYNSLDKKELQKAYNDYSKWIKTDMNSSHPIGEYLNKKTNYNKKPQLIDEKDFWRDEDGNYETDYRLLDKKHWYRGVSAERYSDVLKSNVPDREKTKLFVDEFKQGDYYAGKGINGNGTYVSQSYSYATKYNNDIEEGMIYLMPKENAKIVNIDKINYIKQKIIKHINSNDDLYVDVATVLLDDSGYLAQILGYDIVNLGEHKIILNRGSIKVVK